MRTRALLTLISASITMGTVGLFAACSGSNGSSITADAGEGDATVLDGTVPIDILDASSKDAGHDTGTTTDASSDAGTDSAPPPVFDAGTPVWTNGVVDAGAFTPIGSPVGDTECEFQLGTITVGIPPTYDLYLQKKDAFGTNCNEPDGFVLLVGSVDYPPAAFLARATTAKLLAVTYDYKNDLSGSSPVFPALAQYDWYSGIKLHTGAFILKNTDAGGPPGPGMGSTYVTALSVTGVDVTVTGSGYFPGAPNNDFTAIWDSFLSDSYQASSFADTVN